MSAKINKVIDYIESHLLEKNDYDSLAKIACCSVYNLQRFFSLSANISIADYIRRRKMSLTFAFPILLGGVAGGILGSIATNPFMSVVLSSMGVMKADFIVNPMWVIAMGICIIALSYLTALLITWKILKISAYALVTE